MHYNYTQQCSTAGLIPCTLELCVVFVFQSTSTSSSSMCVILNRRFFLCLQKELTFTICLHYTYSNMDDEVQERQPVTVGKPLVSKLNLHEPRTPRSWSASSSFSLNSFNVPECSYFAEDVASVDSASNTWSYNAQIGREASTTDSSSSSREVNIPEEIDSPELSDAPKPLAASKSLPLSQVNDSNYKFSDMYNFQSY